MLAPQPVGEIDTMKPVLVANIKLLEDPEKNLVVIMKNGKVYKNIAK